MWRKLVLIIFFVFALYYTFLFDTITPSLHMLSKLLPMVLLLILALATPLSTRYKTILTVGLLFCAIGDYTLQWFLIGLSSFLIGHVFYIAAFRSVQFAKTPLPVKIGLLLYGLLMATWLATTLWQRGETILAVAVCAYIAIILCMGWTSFRTAQPLAISGATLFIVSDSVLAVNRFIMDVAFAHEIIMFTYYGAQLLLMLSIAKVRQKMVQ